MALSDDISLFQLRLSALAPQLSQAPQTVLMNLATAFLSANADTAALISAAQANMFLATASGAALDAKALDYNVRRNPGIGAQVGLTFSLPQPINTLLTIPLGVVVATPGDGITTISQTFTTLTATTIPRGAPSSNSNQVETVTLSGATGGTFTLTPLGGTQTTGPLAYNATASAVQSALQALSNVGTSSITGTANVAVTGSAGGPYTVTWQNALGGTAFPVMTASGAGLTGTSPSVTCTISSPSTTMVSAQCTLNGTAGNVAAGMVTSLVTQLGSGLAVTNPLAAAGGVDPDPDAVVRSNAYAAMTSKYGANAIAAAVLGVSGVYDVYVNDPQTGSGTIKIYWSDVTGAAPGLSGDTQSGGVITANTLAASVQNAVSNVLPANLIAYYAPFTTINNISTLSVQVSAPSGYSTTYLTPLVQSGCAAYVQQLVHNQVPTVYGMSQYLNTYLGLVNVLSNFTVLSSTPTISGAVASQTSLWRLTGTPATVVSVARV